MTYGFKDIPIMPRTVGDGLIATALDGVVYTENGARTRQRERGALRL